MELIPPVKREPYRPPPRAPEEGDPGPGTGDREDGLEQQQPSVPVEEAATETASPESGLVIEEVAIAAVATVDAVSPTEPMPAPTPVDSSPPSPPGTDDLPPDAAAEGFGAGIPDAPPAG